MTAGNIFGTAFRVATFGESHGPGIGLVIDGVPPRIPFDYERLAREMARRRPGQSRLVSQRKEGDEVEVLSGVFEGVTTGAPIGMVIYNSDQRSKDYSNIKDLFRPGHADYTYWVKYGVRDYRGGGRSSARETACRVAAGAVAAMVLDPVGVDVWGFTSQVADIVGQGIEREFIEENPVRAACRATAEQMADRIDEARKAGDSVGALVEVRAEGVPPGLGEPCFEKLDAALAGAMMGIGTVKGVEIGSGFNAVTSRGSENNDPFTRDAAGEIVTETNNHGGVLGGISTGMPIVLRCALKPTSSIVLPQQTVDTEGQPVEFQIKGRHDPCIAPRFVPVAEAMVRLVLVDMLIRHRGLEALSPPA